MIIAQQGPSGIPRAPPNILSPESVRQEELRGLIRSSRVARLAPKLRDFAPSQEFAAHQALVRHLTNRGIGVLITDHNVRETLGLTDRAYIIYSGEVLMEGRAEDIVNNPDVRRLYLGEEFRM